MSDTIGYVTIDDYKEYAESVGAALPTEDEQLAIQLLNSTLYIDSKEPLLLGKRTERDQELAYPRTDLKINGFEYGNDEIPAIVKLCQMALALEINDGVDLYAFQGVLPVVKERVEGAVEVQYASPKSAEVTNRQSHAMNLLRQLMRAPSISIPLVRV